MSDLTQSVESARKGVSFRQAERTGARLWFRVRVGGILAIALTLFLRVGGMSLAYYLAILAILLVSGWLLQIVVRKNSEQPFRMAFILCGALIAADMCVITVALVVPAPGTSELWTEPLQLRVGNVGFLFVFLVFSSLTYSPGLALWAGVSAGLAWLGGAIWVLSRPGSFTVGASEFAAMDVNAIIATLTDPGYVSVVKAGQDSLLLAIAGAVCATTVWRGRRHARRQVQEARDRATLSRYFSPDLAAELTSRAAGFGEIRTPYAAVVFADIFGFTVLAERESPEETLGFLREFHHRATGAVFSHGGTLNKFIGDEVMASFGAITEVEAPAAAALACALQIAESVEEWSQTRVAQGLSPVRVGVGLHVGPVAVGNIGDQQCLELAVLGDTVNIANRLQKRTRDLDVAIVASRAVLDAAIAERPDLSGLQDRFHMVEDDEVRGREGRVPTVMLRSG